MFDKVDEKVRLSLRYQADQKPTALSNVKVDATAEDIYDTAVAINSLQVDADLQEVHKTHSYAIKFILD